MITIQAMRPLGDFVKARIFKAGYKSIDEFAKRTGVGKPGIYAVFNAETDQDVESHRGTLEILAEHLQFVEWAHLVKAWQKDDVRAELDSVIVRLPRSHYEEIAAKAAASKMTPAEFIWSMFKSK